MTYVNIRFIVTFAQAGAERVISFRKCFVSYFFTLLLLAFSAFGHAAVPNSEAPQTDNVLNRAQLSSQQGTRWVDLPNILVPADFATRGSIVTYRIPFELAQIPQDPWGIFISKISLAGTVRVNGQSVGTCAFGPLDHLHCAYKPNLFAVPSMLWRMGTNNIEVDVYADKQQSNGLSVIKVGNFNELNTNEYRLRRWLQVDLIEMLTWFSFFFGALGIIVGLMLRRDSVYLWYGIAGIANAVGNLNSTVNDPFVSPAVFSWLILSARLVSAPLFFLTLVTFFDRSSINYRRMAIAYALLGPMIIGLTDNSRLVVTALYVPLMIVGLVVVAKVILWTYRNPKALHILLAGTGCLVYAAGAYDWTRLSGHAAFDGILVIPYTYTVILLLIGVLLIRLLVRSLVESRELSTHLEARVIERTTQLEAAHAKILLSEVERSRSTERTRMLQDMHDGFGSQLASARLLAEQKQLSHEALTQLLQECMSDLYLVVDTLGNPLGSVVNAIADFKFRTERRLIDRGLALHWVLQVEEMPDLESHIILQILRISQEALNNALKHAKAKNIWIEFVYNRANHRLHVRIADDGVGFHPKAVQLGRGLNNMQTRATTIGGTLNITHGDGGTEVTVTMPL